MARRSDYKPKLSRTLTLGDIDSEIINDIIQLIYEINEEDAKKTQVEPIKLIINSFGGEVYSGLALIDVIDNSLTPVYTICHGSAMSMALIIYAAGHQRMAKDVKDKQGEWYFDVKVAHKYGLVNEIL